MTNETDFAKRFARRLRRKLETYGWSERELSRRMGVSVSIVSNWCRGFNIPRMGKIDKMCDLFHCSRGDLIGENADDAAEECNACTERTLLMRELVREIEGSDLETLEKLSGLLKVLKQ